MNHTPQRTAPIIRRSLISRAADWIRLNLFSSAFNTIVTLALVALLFITVPPLWRWAVSHAVLQPDPQLCRAASGACWGFIAEKWRLILYGLYPLEEQWRPFTMMVILISLIVLTLGALLRDMRFWKTPLLIIWFFAVIVMAILMWGGVFGLPYVENSKWGGLSLTLILTVNGIVFSFPIAVLLALGRRSDLPVFKAICTALIEIIRGVPLITVLFMASLMLPFFLPEGMTINKLLRAQIGIILFASVYLAEIIRGGLQSLPQGQYEAADALGLTYWQKTISIILPQALRLVIPPMVNNAISLFKDTSLVMIIALYDLLGATKLGANDPVWRIYYVEGLVFVAAVYFIFCTSFAAYSRAVENKALQSERR